MKKFLLFNNQADFNSWHAKKMKEHGLPKKNFNAKFGTVASDKCGTDVFCQPIKHPSFFNNKVMVSGHDVAEDKGVVIDLEQAITDGFFPELTGGPSNLGKLVLATSVGMAASIGAYVLYLNWDAILGLL